MTRPYREVGKPFALRTIELLRALQLVRDSITAIRAGRAYHLVSLSGQLRALLCERNPKADPLLIEVAKAMGRPLRVYCMPDVNDPALPESLLDGLLLHVAGFPISPRRQFPAQLEMSFSDLVQRNIVLYKERHYTIEDLIAWYANWAGGAHYSRNLPEDFAELLSVGVGGVAPIANALLQVGEATLAAGRDLLKSVVDLEIHFVVVVPKQRVGEVNYIFDAQYEGSAMRLSITLNARLMPGFFVSGLQGIAAMVESDRLIDWSSPRHLQASVRIEDDLTTVLEIVVDGERVGRGRVQEPVFVLSDPLDYELYHNRAVDSGPQNFSFGVVEAVMVASEPTPANQANLFLHFEARRKDPEVPLVFYAPESYGHAPRGTKDVAVTGNVRRLRVKSLLPEFRQ